MIKSLKKNIEEKKKDTKSNSSSDNEFKPKLEPNINHILREQQEIDNEKYEQVIDGKQTNFFNQKNNRFYFV